MKDPGPLTAEQQLHAELEKLKKRCAQLEASSRQFRRALQRVSVVMDAQAKFNAELILVATDAPAKPRPRRKTTGKDTG